MCKRSFLALDWPGESTDTHAMSFTSVSYKEKNLCKSIMAYAMIIPTGSET